MVYSFLKFSCSVALRFFFRKWQVHLTSPLPKAPTIFIANHPNAFLDAILVACSVDHQPWFLARGEVFRKKWSAFLLSRFRMLPIYRFRDGYHTLRRNDDIITRCANLLSKGNSVLIFPEGDNSLQSKLLPLQKGFIKIAEKTLQLAPDLNLQIVPVGIQYHDTRGFGGTAEVSIGKAVSFTSLAGNTAQQQLDLFWEKMNALITDQKVIHAAPNKLPILPSLINFYFQVNHFLLTLCIRLIVSFIAEEQMKNSVRFAGGLFLTAPVYLIQSLLVGFLTKSAGIALVYLATLPVSVLIKHNTTTS
jgi:1-acyl-sn-glycerol-3-phosphate acyltransferase